MLKIENKKRLIVIGSAILVCTFLFIICWNPTNRLWNTSVNDTNVLEENELLTEELLNQCYERYADLSYAEIIQAVLTNELPFTCYNNYNYDNGIYRGYLKNMVYNSQIANISEFTITDMDGNNVPEVILAITGSYSEYCISYIILRYQDHSISGNIIGNREMIDLKDNGSFISSGGAMYTYIGKCFFVGTNLIFDYHLSCIEGNSSCLYYIDDIPVDKTTFEVCKNSFYNDTDTEWYAYTTKTIEKIIALISVWPHPTDDMVIISIERQNYLDNLSYLIEFKNNVTKNTSIYEESEEMMTNAKAYYYNSLNELEIIYTQCQENISSEEYVVFEYEQQTWLNEMKSQLSQKLSNYSVNNIDEVQNSDIYIEFGNIIVRRILKLINTYYGWNYYE